MPKRLLIVLAVAFICLHTKGQVSLPYSEDFEGVTDQTYQDNTSSITGLPDWELSMLNSEDYTLTLGDIGYNDSKGMSLRNVAVGGDSDQEGITLELDLSNYSTTTDIFLSFRMKPNGLGSFGGGPFMGIGHELVLIRGSDSDAWIEFYDPQNEIEDTGWYHFVDLPVSDSLLNNGQDFSSTFQLRFFTSQITFQIDDVEITERPTNDIRLLSTDLDVTGVYTSTETISVEFENFGTANVSNLPLTVSIDGPSASETRQIDLSTTLSSEAAQTVDLEETFDFSEMGTYSIEMYHSLETDENNNNDTLRFSVIHVSPIVPTLPYLVDFTSVVSDQERSQFMASIEGLEGFSYHSNQEEELLSFPAVFGYEGNDDTHVSLGAITREETIEGNLVMTLDLSGFQAANNDLLLDFNYRYRSINTRQVRVRIRGNASEEWLDLYTFTGNDDWTSVFHQSISELLDQNNQDFSGSTQISFKDRHRNSISDLRIDNIRIHERPENDLSLAGNTHPDHSPSLGSMEQVAVDIHNFGKNATSSFDLLVEVEGPGTQNTFTETINTAIASEDTLEYTLTNAFDFSAVGDYDVTVVASLDGDSDSSNDSIHFRTSQLSTFTSSLPFSATFDGLASDFQTFESVGEIGGIEGLGFTSSTDEGFVATGISDEIDEQGLQIGSTGGQPVNDLILTFDLSSHDANADDLLLNLKYYYNRFSTNQTDENGIFLRGDLDDDWIDMGTWFDGTGMNGAVLSKNHMVLSDSLLAYSQNYSTRTQIRVSEQGATSSGGAHLTVLEIAVFERPDFDIVLENMVVPSNSAALSDMEDVTVTLVNQGAQSASNIPITIVVDNSGTETSQNEVIAGPINSLDELEVTLTNTIDLSTPGTYQITVYTALASDADTNSDTLRNESSRLSRYEDALPLFEDFEDLSASFDSIGFQPFIDNATGFSFETSTGFGKIQSSSVDETTYLKVTTSSSSSGSESQLILSADMSDYTTGNDQIFLDFSYLFSQFSSRLDHENNEIFIRGSDDDNWLPFYDWSVTDQGDDREEAFYLNITDSLAANGQDFSESFQIDFREGQFGSSSFLSVDDIHLYHEAANDVQLSAVVPPTEAAGLGSSEQISVQIINRGTEAQSTIPVSVEFRTPADTTTFDEELSVSIAAGDTTSVTLTQTFDFSDAGHYAFKVALGLSDDPNNKFDTLINSTNKFDSYTGELPYFEDFEDVESLFTRTAISAVTNADGFSYQKNNDVTSTNLRSSTIDESVVLEMNGTSGAPHDLVLTMDLSDYTTEAQILLSFDYAQFNQSDDANDRVFVRGSEDDAWIELFDWYDPEVATNDLTFQEVDSLDLSEALSNESQTFSTTTQIRFGEEGGQEFLLDNVHVFKVADNDVALVSLDVPDWGPELGSNNQLTFTLENRGKQEEVNVPLTIEIEGPDGSQAATETIGTVAFTDESISYTTETVFDFSSLGSYQITAYLELSTDENLENDTIATTSVHVTKAASSLPFLESFNGLNTEISYTNSTTEISDINGFSYRSTGNLGNLGADDTFSNSGTSIRMGSNESQSDADHELILSVDLSEHALADSILLDLSIAGHRNTLVTENDFNKISVRGNQFDEWVELYDWYESATNNDLVWTSVTGLNISRVLGAAGTTFSNTFQLRIGKRDLAGIDEELWIDDLKLYRSFNGLSDGAGFTIAETGYVGLGRDGTGNRREIWKLDENFNMEFYSIFPGESRSGAVAFAIGDLFYVGMGVTENGEHLTDFYEYDALNNQWNQLTDFPGEGMSNATVFVIESFAYVGTGLTPTDEQSAFWKYDPTGDSWTSIESLPSGKKQGAFSFAVNGKGYVGGGFYIDDFTTIQMSDLQEYDPATNTWTEKIFADGTNLSVNEAAAFSLYGFGYIAYGNQDQLVQYDPSTNEVTNLGDQFNLGDSRSNPTAFILGDSAVVAFGSYDLFPTQYSSEFNVFFEENNAPSNLSLDNSSLSENNDVGQLVGTLTAQDDGTSITFAFATGDGSNDADNASFSISGDQLLAQEVFDFESQATYRVFVQASDERGETISQAFTISVIDTNENPTDITLSSTSVGESTNGADVFVGTMAAVDQDVNDSFTYSIIQGDGTNDVDNAQFYISNGNQLNLLSPSFEVQSSFIVRISAQDLSGASFAKTFTITLTDQNDIPTDIQLDNLTIEEGSATGTLIGTFTTTDEDNPDPSSFTYQLEESSQELFTIDGDQLFTSAAFESFAVSEDTEVTINAISSDDDGASAFKELIITVLNQSDPLSVEQDSEIRVYPNPFSHELRIDLKSFRGKSVQLEITNINGQVLRREQLEITSQDIRLDLSGLAIGTYLIKLKSGPQIITQQIFKK